MKAGPFVSLTGWLTSGRGRRTLLRCSLLRRLRWCLCRALRRSGSLTLSLLFGSGLTLALFGLTACGSLGLSLALFLGSNEGSLYRAACDLGITADNISNCIGD